MKGDNIIEAYCHICNKPITLADISLGFSKEVDGKKIHLHHDEEILKKQRDPVLHTAMVELYSRIIEKGEKATSFFSVFCIAQEVARELGLETDDVVQQFRADMVRNKYQKKDPV